MGNKLTGWKAYFGYEIVHILDWYLIPKLHRKTIVIVPYWGEGRAFFDQNAQKLIKAFNIATMFRSRFEPISIKNCAICFFHLSIGFTDALIAVHKIHETDLKKNDWKEHWILMH